MDERVARDVILVRALETAPGANAFTDDDRRYASRAAVELANWQAAGRAAAASAATAPEFVGQRAGLLVGKLKERQPALVRAAQALHWPAWLDLAVPPAALLAGALIEQVGDRQRVSLLAFPLLAIVLWNLLVYLLLIAGAAWPARPKPLAALVRATAGWRAGPPSRNASAGAGRSPARDAVGAFTAEWTRCSAPLLRARSARLLHLAAAAFAAGAVAALYLRGLVLEYRVGWESTFLEPAAVHALLSFFLAPLSALLGQPFPTVDEIAALRFGARGAGASGARWIHLYALLVGLVVIAPRLLLAALSALRARYLARRFPLDLDAPYFRRLLAEFGRQPVRVRVLPYSYTPDEAALEGLRQLARRLFGARAELMPRPPVEFGAEERAADGLAGTEPDAVQTVALFSLAATPEPENHGRLLDTLRSALGHAPAAVVDETGYRQRLGPGGADRLAERRAAWRSLCASRGVAVACVDLAAPDLDQAERDLSPMPGAGA